jgi:hypothetical protein
LVCYVFNQIGNGTYFIGALAKLGDDLTRDRNQLHKIFEIRDDSADTGLAFDDYFGCCGRSMIDLSGKITILLDIVLNR